MSRCFPYPPPHFHESLIKSIKIQKEQEKTKKEERAKAKEEKKEKKREKKLKKEKNREKVEQAPEKLKNREIDQLPANLQHKEKSHKKRKYGEVNTLLEQKDRFIPKTSKDAVEQFEGSGLTEEHETPCSIQYKHDSPESSQDSSKRRKLLPSVSGQNMHGSILRIKIPSSKQGLSFSQSHSSTQTKSDIHLPSSVHKSTLSVPTQVVAHSKVPVVQLKQIAPVKQPCFAGKSKQTATHPACEQPCVAGKLKQIAAELPAAREQSCLVGNLKQIPPELPAVCEQPCFSGREAAAAAVPSQSKRSSSRRIGGRTWQNDQFRDLVVSWNPMSLQSAPLDTADDWLLGAQQQDSSTCTRKSLKQNSSYSASSSLVGTEGSVIPSQQPRACYLPEIETYQLPYVIPF